MCLEASWILVYIFQVLDLFIFKCYFKLSSTVLETMVPEHFVFNAKQKTTLAVNRTRNTTQACSLPFIAFLQSRLLERFVHLV